MKASRLSSMLFGAVLVCAIPTLAGNTVKKSLELSETVTVQGVQLAPGDYKVEWSGTGPDVQVSILKHNNTVVTVPGHIIAENSSNTNTGYALKAAPDGSKQLSEVFFSGEKFDLQLEQGAGANSGGTPSAN